MPDHDAAPESTTLEALADEVRSLKARLQMMEAQSRPQAQGPPQAVVPHADLPADVVLQEPDANGAVTRRGAFKVLGAAAAGGVGVALGSAIVSAEPAAATTGAMQYGVNNFAGSDPTILSAVTAADAVTFLARNFEASGHALYGLMANPSGIGPTSGSAVIGDTIGSSPGVEGLSGGGTGVHGVSGSSTGGMGPGGPIGVSGESTDGIGAAGVSINAIGLFGLTYNSKSAGVLGQDGSSDGGVSVWGTSFAGIGGFFAGGHAPLQLGTGTGTGPPTGAGHSVGEVYVDTVGALFYCYAGDGTTSEWVALTNGTFPIPPVRVIDTATGTGGITGPLVPGSTVHTSSAIAGTHGIPAAAVGVVGNLAISGVSGALLNGVGFATLFPAGEATPATANINAGAGCFAISNAVTVGLGSGGSNAGKLSLVWSGGGPVPHAEAYFDVTGYIL